MATWLGKGTSALSGLFKGLKTDGMDVAAGIAKTKFMAYSADFATQQEKLFGDNMATGLRESLNVLKNNPMAVLNDPKTFKAAKDVLPDSFFHGQEYIDYSNFNIYNSYLNKVDGFGDDVGRQAKSAIDSYTNKTIGQFKNASFQDKFAMSGDYASAYFFGDGGVGGNMLDRTHLGRMGAAAVGISSAGRILGGGSVGRTANGEQDIIGIPFI